MGRFKPGLIARSDFLIWQVFITGMAGIKPTFFFRGMFREWGSKLEEAQGAKKKKQLLAYSTIGLKQYKRVPHESLIQTAEMSISN